MERRKVTEKKKNQNSSTDGVRAEGELEIRPEMMIEDSTKEGKTNQKVEGEQKNPGHCFTPDSEDPPRTEQRDDNMPTAASSTAAPQHPEEPPDVSDMLPFNLNSLGGECVVSLSLMSLGLLNIYISIPKHIVVVDSNLVDNETVKRSVNGSARSHKHCQNIFIICVYCIVSVGTTIYKTEECLT